MPPVFQRAKMGKAPSGNAIAAGKLHLIAMRPRQAPLPWAAPAAFRSRYRVEVFGRLDQITSCFSRKITGVDAFTERLLFDLGGGAAL